MIGRQAAFSSWVLAVGCVFLVGCSGSPSVASNTPAAAPPPSAPSATIPPGPVPAQTADRSGTYAGMAQPMNTAGGTCTRPLQVNGFRVSGNSVRFGAFRGTIDSAGGLQMANGGQWIVGQFEGATFNGQFTFPPQNQRRGRTSGPSSGPGCSFALNLDRTGP
jgi:hypothetical protein